MSKFLDTRLVQHAYGVACFFHSGQVDKGGAPYIRHPIAVAKMLETEYEQTTALLHDVIEDTDLELNDLRHLGFPEEVVAAVDCLTKRKGEPRTHYLNRVKSNPLATRVKLADLKHNSDLTRIPSDKVTEKDLARTARYRLDIAFLETET